ncbi:MAG: polysaccharide pyruvyl transferase family protein [Bacteroidales bacterium]|nr:polysaccharide pyruvyl transferase family protein [Bacteroidales bacterium]
MKKKIINDLTPLIDNDYIFLDLPYYTNIGDTLIWKGTEAFLRTLPYKCLYKTAIETYIKPDISKNIVILVQGGGNFGDLWRRHNDFCLKLITEFPENKIIILPKSVYYENKDLIKIDARLMAKHSNLIICARDTVSYETLTFFFSNRILLVPDMAFAISETYLRRLNKVEENNALFFKRKDKEYNPFDYESHLSCSYKIEESEWPSMGKELFASLILSYLKTTFIKTRKLVLFNKVISKITDWYAVHIYMPYLIRIGVRFLGSYKYIYTTRLHGAILGMLLNKHITFFDNSYGKNYNFYQTWLKNVPDIVFFKNKHRL